MDGKLIQGALRVSGLTLVAIGNNGAYDRASGNARVQVPSDSVNAVAIGAADKSSQSGGEQRIRH